MGMFSNLNLNGPSAVRVQPHIGEWGPSEVPTTRTKKRLRALIWVVFLVALTILCATGYFFYKLLNG